MKIYTNELVKGHSDFKVKCLTFGLYTQVSDSGPLGPLVYHIWAWRPCWSCDPTHLYKFSFLFSLKLSYEFWFQIAQLFLRKTSFNIEI